MSPSSVHLLEETLESYAMRRLPEDECSPIEEHLLFCETCQDRLVDVDDYVLAIRFAAQRLLEEDRRKIVATPAPIKRSWWLSTPVWATACALFFIGITVSVRQYQPGTISQVDLGSSSRGQESGSVAHVRSGDIVRLNVDLTQLTHSSSYRLEFVDLNGKQLWESTVAPLDNHVTGQVGRVSAGTYWVRLYAAAGDRKLLREYGIVVR